MMTVFAVLRQVTLTQTIEGKALTPEQYSNVDAVFSTEAEALKYILDTDFIVFADFLQVANPVKTESGWYATTWRGRFMGAPTTILFRYSIAPLKVDAEIK